MTASLGMIDRGLLACSLERASIEDGDFTLNDSIDAFLWPHRPFSCRPEGL